MLKASPYNSRGGSKNLRNKILQINLHSERVPQMQGNAFYRMNYMQGLLKRAVHLHSP